MRNGGPAGAPPSGRRLPPADRRKALLRAAADCLVERGYAATSVREICRRAGVSPGLLTHYFPGKTALIAEVYRDVADALAGDLAAAVDAAGPDPVDRLRAFIRASFRPPTLSRDTIALWLVFWTLSLTDKAVAELHRQDYARYRDTLVRLIGDVAAARGEIQDLRLAALSLTALIDGLWLEWCLDPKAFTPEEAAGIALGWVHRPPARTSPSDPGQTKLADQSPQSKLDQRSPR